MLVPVPSWEGSSVVDFWPRWNRVRHLLWSLWLYIYFKVYLFLLILLLYLMALITADAASAWNVAMFAWGVCVVEIGCKDPFCLLVLWWLTWAKWLEIWTCTVWGCLHMTYKVWYIGSCIEVHHFLVHLVDRKPHVLIKADLIQCESNSRSGTRMAKALPHHNLWLLQCCVVLCIFFKMVYLVCCAKLCWTNRLH